MGILAPLLKNGGYFLFFLLQTGMILLDAYAFFIRIIQYMRV